MFCRCCGRRCRKETAVDALWKLDAVNACTSRPRLRTAT
jgi:hypothetical protein